MDEFEERVPISFIRKVQAKLQERPNHNKEQQVCSMFNKSIFFIFFYLSFVDIAYGYQTQLPRKISI